MDVTVSRGALAEELGLCAAIAARKETIPAAAGVQLSAGDGLALAATDIEEIALRTRLEAVVAAAGTVVVPARRLAEIVKELPDGYLRIWTDGTSVRLEQGAYRARLGTVAADDFPSIPEPDGVGLTILCADLQRLIQRTQFAAGSVSGVTGALLTRRAAEWRIVATDGHRLALADLPVNGGPKSALEAIVPRRALTEILKLVPADGDAAADLATIYFGAAQLFVEIGARQLMSRIADGKFPAYARIVPAASIPVRTFARADLAAAIRRVALVAAEVDAVVFTAQGTACRLQAQSAEAGEAEDVVAVTGPDLTTALKARYVLDFLEVVGTEAVTVAAEPEATTRWMAADDSTYIYVIGPVRM